MPHAAVKASENDRCVSQKPTLHPTASLAAQEWFWQNKKTIIYIFDSFPCKEGGSMESAAKSDSIRLTVLP